MNKQDIITRIRLQLDEVTPEFGVTHPIDAIINPLLDESTRQYLKSAPVLKLRQSSYTVTTTNYSYDSSNGSHSIVLTDDVLRLVSVKFPSWIRKVTNFFKEGSVEEAHQANEFTRAGIVKPVVIESQKTLSSNMNKSIICYTHPEVTSANLGTIDIKVISDQKAEDLNDDLIPAIVVLTALNVANTFKDVATAKILTEKFTMMS